MQQVRAPSVRLSGTRSISRAGIRPVCVQASSRSQASSLMQRTFEQPRMRQQQLGTRTAATARPSVFLFGFGGDDEVVYDDEECTVIKLQVGIFGDITKWQQKFERMAEHYDTEETEGLHELLQETLQLLVRNSEYCQYALSAGRVYDNFDEAESKFNQVSFDERSKVKEETLSNVDGRKNTESEKKPAEQKDMDQWMSVTLLLAVARQFKLPQISTVYDLQQALKTLAGVGVDDLMAFELLWTPQREGDSYSKDELLMDFPTLVTLI